MEKNSRILITGGSGFVGTNLAHYLNNLGYDNVMPLSSKTCNLTNREETVSFFKKHQPEYVFHLAARVFGIMGNMQNQGLSFLDNTLINTYVVEACHQSGVKKVVAMGTGAVYPYPPVRLPFKEEDVWQGVPHPSERGYAHAKRHMLAQLETYYENYGMDYAFPISANIYGPHDCFDAQQGHVVPALVYKFYQADINNGPISIWGNGSAQRDFIYGEDMAQALTLIMLHHHGPINVGSGTFPSIKEVVEHLYKAVNNPNIKIEWDSSKPNGQEKRNYDLSKLQSIGFVPKTSISEGLKKTYTWFKENYKNARIG